VREFSAIVRVLYRKIRHSVQGIGKIVALDRLQASPRARQILISLSTLLFC
jgi:hypothetical protein